MSKNGIVIVLGGLKGGTGRTTIATNMAAKFCQLGYRTALVGVDDQEPLVGWDAGRATNGRSLVAKTGRTMCRLEVFDLWENRSLRSGPAPSVETLNSQPLNYDVDYLKSMATKFDFVIVDVGARARAELLSVLRFADFLISPFRASAIDIWTLPDLKEIIDEALLTNSHLQIGFLLNEISGDTTREYISSIRSDIDDLIGGHPGYFQFSQELGYQETYRETVQSGLAINELPVVDREAVREFTGLFDAVTKVLKEKCRSDFIIRENYAGYWA